MSVQLKPIETTTDKLSTIAFAAGQYIIVTDGDKAGYVYYDSAITLKRECLRGEEQPETTIDWTGDPTTVNLGGVLAGSVVTGKTSEQLLYDITHPFVAPTLSMNISDIGGIFQKNTTKNITSISLTSSGGSVGAFKDKTVQLFNNNVVIDPAVYNIVFTSDISATVTFKTPIVLDGTVDTTIKVNVTIKGNNLTVSKAFVFVNPIYYGVSSVNTGLDATLASSALLKDIKTKTNLSYAYTASNAYSYVLYDKSWGQLTSIIDQNNFNITNSYNIETITIGGIDYYLYIAKSPSTVNNFTIKFNF